MGSRANRRTRNRLNTAHWPRPSVSPRPLLVFKKAYEGENCDSATLGFKTQGAAEVPFVAEMPRGRALVW